MKPSERVEELLNELTTEPPQHWTRETVKKDNANNKASILTIIRELEEALQEIIEYRWQDVDVKVTGHVAVAKLRDIAKKAILMKQALIQIQNQTQETDIEQIADRALRGKK